MPRGKKHSDETKAAVLAALLSGQGVCDVAQQYKIPKSVVSGWKSEISSNELEQIRTKKTDEFNELLSNAIIEIFKTLAFSVQFIRTDEGLAWLKQHSPAEAATFIGVTTDKGIRLLEAAGNAELQHLETSSESADHVPESIQ